MSNNSWNQTLLTAQVDSTALTASTTPTSILPAAARFNFPSNLWQIGTKLRIKASGRMTTAASTPGTLTLDVRLGASTVIFNGGATGTVATSQTNLTWDLDIDLTCRSIGGGTSGTVLGTGRFTTFALSATLPIFVMPASAPAVGTGFDSTASNFIDLFGTWSASNANSITTHQYELILCN